MHYFHFKMHLLHFKKGYFAAEIHYLHFKKGGSEKLLKVKYVKVGPAPLCRRLFPWPVRIAWTKIRLCGRIVNMCRFFYNFVCKLVRDGFIFPVARRGAAVGVPFGG